MFSALFSAQNRPVLIITINSASFQYSNDGTTWTNIPIDGKTITYDSLNYQVRLLSVEPADATYSSSIPLPISQQGQTAQAVITGTGSYTGSIISPNLTISASPITIAPSGSTSFSYNGSSKTVGYTVSGVYEADTNYAVSETSSTNAGSYTATLTTTSSNYVLGTTTNIPWTISKAILTITTNNASMIYGSSLPTFTHTSTGFVNSETSTVITGTVTHSTTGSSTSNAGTYSITPSVSGLTATNYTFTPVNGTLTINPATLTASTRTGSTTYTGSSQAFTVLSGINGTTYTGSTSVSGTNVGSYTTTIIGTGNYTGSVTGTLTINAATLAASTTTGSATYDGGSKTATVISGINGTYSGSTSVSGINAGTYSTTITGTGNYAGSVGGTLTINPATLTAANRVGSATYTGFSQAATVISGINGTYSGSTSVSGINAGTYSTTITGTGNYTGSVTGTLTINQAQLTASTTTSPHTFYNRRQQSFTISGINGTYSDTPTVYGTNAGSYSTTIYGTGNYTGSVTGTLIIYQDVGYVDIFYGGVHDASRTTSIFVPVRTSNAAFTVTHSTSGPGAADAQHTSFGLDRPYDWNGLYDPVPPGAVVRNTNPYTQGFVVTITAAINDPNYGYMSATTSVTVNAYVAPPPTGGGVTE